MSDSNVYQAERILSKRKLHGVTQYLIKWKGYSLKDNTWEPSENILDRGLVVAFEKATASAATSTATSSHFSSSSSSSASSQESHHPTAGTKRGRPNVPKKSYSQQRQEQVRLQRHIEAKQSKKRTTTTTAPNNTTTTTSTSNCSSGSPSTDSEIGPVIRKVGAGKRQLVVFNPVRGRSTLVEELVYEPQLTKDPILVTDVTAKDLTVTISECGMPEGFFRT